MPFISKQSLFVSNKHKNDRRMIKKKIPLHFINAAFLVVLILIILVLQPYSFIDTNNCFKNLILVENEAHFIHLLKLINDLKNNFIM